MSPSQGPTISSGLTILMATACGLIVANIYYAQPLIGPIASQLGIPISGAGLIVTLTQLGYGFGLLLIVPLADQLENRSPGPGRGRHRRARPDRRGARSRCAEFSRRLAADRLRLGRGPGPFAARRPHGARGAARPGGRRHRDGHHARDHGGAAGRELSRGGEFMARRLFRRYRRYGRARARAGAGAAAPPADRGHQLRRADGLDDWPRRAHADPATARLLPVVPVRRLLAVLDDRAAASRRRLRLRPARHRAVRAGRRFGRDRRAAFRALRRSRLWPRRHRLLHSARRRGARSHSDRAGGLGPGAGAPGRLRRAARFRRAGQSRRRLSRHLRAGRRVARPAQWALYRLLLRLRRDRLGAGRLVLRPRRLAARRRARAGLSARRSDRLRASSRANRAAHEAGSARRPAVSLSPHPWPMQRREIATRRRAGAAARRGSFWRWRSRAARVCGSWLSASSPFPGCR